MDLDNSDSPSALVFTRDGDYAFVALQGNNQVVIIDMINFRRDDSARFMFDAPWGWTSAAKASRMDTSGEQLLVHEFMQRSIGVLDMSAFLDTGSIALPRQQIDVQSVEILNDEVLAGKRIFYNAADPKMGAEGYISCATCHLDGGHDGMVWDFTQRDEGLRNTTAIFVAREWRMAMSIGPGILMKYKTLSTICETFWRHGIFNRSRFQTN